MRERLAWFLDQTWEHWPALEQRMIADGRLNFTAEDFWPHDHMEKLVEEDLALLVRLSSDHR